MVPRENENNAYAKFGGTNKQYYGILRTGLLDDTKSYCQLIIKITISEKNSQVVKKGESSH